MELFLVLLIIVTIGCVIFSKQVSAWIISTKQKLNKNIKTSVKIRMTIEEIGAKQKKMDEVYFEVNKYTEKVKQAYNREVDRAIEDGEVEGILIEKVWNRNEGVYLKKGVTVNVVSIKTYYRKTMYVCSTPKGIIEVGEGVIELQEGGSKHLARCSTLKKIIDTYDSKAKSIQSVVEDLSSKQKSLGDDADYVETMESLKSVASINGIDYDADLANIMAEIIATEKSLELEESLNNIGKDV